MKVVLISTYELGRQPFGLASPAAWLRRDGFEVSAIDCAVDSFPEASIREADMIAFYVPMHTATRLALRYLQRAKGLNPEAHFCFYGLYAPLNEPLLRARGVSAVLGGEFEQALLDVCRRLRDRNSKDTDFIPANISLEKLKFIRPDRRGLPPISRYAKLCDGRQAPRPVGYVEATRGCKHLCRHCPITPVYGGKFRVVQADVVLADIAQQVAAGARHITFGDPDFFNGPGHGMKIVRALPDRFPGLTYDVTIKIEHLRKYDRLLQALKDTGCTLVTTAVESLEPAVLRRLAKGHTADDVQQVVHRFQELALALNPTFVPFTPWTSLDGYRRLLDRIRAWELIPNISPVQYAIRLLIPRGSRLLELPDTDRFIGPFDEERLTYIWQHQDRRIDRLQETVAGLVEAGSEADRHDVWRQIRRAADKAAGKTGSYPQETPQRKAATIPYLTEPWYC